MRSRLLLAASAAAGLVLAAAPVVAQTPLPDPAIAPDPLDARDARRVERMEKVVRELRSIVFKMRDTGVPVVVQPADTDARLADLALRLDDLQQSLTRVNGSLEMATREIDLLKRDNAALQNQVKALGEQLAAQTPPPPGPGDMPQAGDPGPPTASAGEAFTQARQQMLGGDYDGAERAFAAFVQNYPDDPKAPEARYWLGKTLTVRGASGEAASAYIGAIRGWPQTSWAPDGLVELSRALIALKKPADACQALKELPKRYPKASANVTTRAAKARTDAKCA